MDFFIIIIVSLLLLIGLIGSIVPILPGPPISFLAVLILHFFSPIIFNSVQLIILFIIVLFVTLLDYFLQVFGVNKFGGGRTSINFTIIGLIAGIFITPFFPFGILLGPFFGAYIGAIIEKNKNPFKIALGSLAGFVSGTFLKIILSLYIIYFCIIQLV